MVIDVTPTIETFCKERMLSPALTKAFVAYAKRAYAQEFNRNENTVTMELLISRMDEARVKTLWLKFVSELRETILTGEHT